MISQPALGYPSHPMRTALPRMLAALALALLLPGGAFARQLLLPAPGVPAAPLLAGQEVVTVIPALPAEVREFELVLVPDVGPAVQVSAECEVGAREVRWRVPRLSGTSARLVLRAGSEHDEFASVPSAPLVLVESSSRFAPAFDASAWLGERDSRPASFGSGAASTLADGGPLAGAAEAPDDGDAAEAPACEHAPLVTITAFHRDVPALPTSDRQPRFTPLRN